MKNRFRGLSEPRKLEMLQMSVEEIYNAGYSDRGFEEAFKSAKKATKKSPNQLRAELIQRAREFVEEHERDLPGRWDCRDYGNRTCRAEQYETEFVVKGRKVIALIYTVSGLRKRVRSYKRPSLIGRAKCHPDEVFNADIGKAIALARALEIEIPAEFMDAVQPDVKVVGMILKSGKEFPEALFGPFEKGREFKLVENLKKLESECLIGSPIEESATITDDTHAEYEVPSC